MTPQKEFVAACKQLARARKISANRLFNQAERYELTPSWFRDRFYDRTKVSKEDVERVRLISAGRDIAHEAVKTNNRAQAAVDAFCKNCVGHDVACRFRTCELRPVSPYPYIKLEGRRSLEDFEDYED
jgi:hypothetical protein